MLALDDEIIKLSECLGVYPASVIMAFRRPESAERRRLHKNLDAILDRLKRLHESERRAA